MKPVTYSQIRNLVSTPYLLDLSRYGVTTKTISVIDVDEEDLFVQKFGTMEVLWIEPNVSDYLIITIEEPEGYEC